MKTRENLELLNELPLDFLYPDPILKPLPNSLPCEMSEEIMLRAPAKMTLFAQASSYWRSYCYLQQLKDAVLMQFNDEQERILTNLLINSELLLKEAARKNLPQWIGYLKKYYFDQKINIKNRLFAQALLLMVDNESTPRQMREFEVVLKAYCFSIQGSPKSQLYHSLMIMVGNARGVAVPQQKPNMKELIGQGPNRIESVCEGQLMLAPFASQYLSEDNFPFVITESYADMISERNPLSYILLLHAAVKMFPRKSAFWQQDKDAYLNLLDQLPSGSYMSDQRSARYDLIATLMGSISADKNPWSDGLDDALQESFIHARRAKALLALVTDADRLQWLETTFTGMRDTAQYHFARRVCARLTSDGACTSAVNILLRAINREAFVGNNDLFVSLIGTLLAKLGSAQNRMVVAKELYEMPVVQYMFFRKASFIFAYLPEEMYQECLEKEYVTLKCLDWQSPIRFLPAFCEIATSEKQIAYWLRKFQTLIDSMPTDFGENSKNISFWFDIIECYNNLVLKKRDSILLQKWQLTLQRISKMSKFYEWEALVLAMKILPSLNSEAVDYWMALLKKQIPHSDLSRDYSALLITCVSQLFSTFSPEKQAEWWGFVNEMLSSQSFIIETDSVLNALPNLLCQLPDELMLDLAPAAQAPRM